MKEGICFICGKPCEKESYAHLECALEYSEKESKERKARKLIKKDLKKTKRMEKRIEENRRPRFSIIENIIKPRKLKPVKIYRL